MFRFVADQNVSRFEDRLRSESDSAKRYLLRTLLIEEEDRFAAGSERLQMAERHIEACNVHISKQKVLLQRLNGTGDPAQLREAKRLLINLLELRDIYESVRQVSDEVCRNRLMSAAPTSISLSKTR